MNRSSRYCHPKKLYAKHAHWLRIYILYRQGKKAQVRAAAQSYVRRYKTAPHRDAAIKLIDWYK